MHGIFRNRYKTFVTMCYDINSLLFRNKINFNQIFYYVIILFNDLYTDF